MDEADSLRPNDQFPTSDYESQSPSRYAPDPFEEGAHTRVAGTHHINDQIAEEELLVSEQLTPTTERQLTSPNERQFTATNERQLTTTNERQLPSSIERQLSSSNERQMNSTNERQLALPNEKQLTATNERQLTATNERQLTTTNERQLSSSIERQLTSSNERQMNSTNERQLTSPNEKQLTATNERQLTATNERQLTTTNERQLSSSIERQLTSSNESQMNSTNERQLTSTNERQLTSTHERQLTSANERQLASANERWLTPRGTSDKGDSKSEEKGSTEQQPSQNQLDDSRRTEELQGAKTKLRSEIRSMFEQVGTLSIAVFHSIVVIIIQASISLQERYTHVDFATLLQENCTERPQKVLDLLASVTILEKYARNLLKPVRPAFWRIVKFSNGIFKTKVDIIQGSRPVLQKLGYTVYAQDGLAFPDDQPEPDVVRVVEIAADLIQARLELEMIICGTHPQPDTMYIIVPREIFQQAEQLAKDQYYQRQREQASLAYSVETKAPQLVVVAQTESSGAAPESGNEQLQQNAPEVLSHSDNGAEPQMQLQSQEQQHAVAPAAEVMYCKVCEEPATEWCRSCEAAHCRTCDAQLHKHKTRRNHDRVPIAQMHEPPGEQESQPPANESRSLPIRTISSAQRSSDKVAAVAPSVQSGVSLGGQPLDVASGVKPSQSLGPQPARTQAITPAAVPQASGQAGSPIPDLSRRVTKFEIEIAKYRVEIEEINERQSKFSEATPEFVELEKKRQDLLKQKAMVEEALRQLTGTERRMQMERQQQQQQQQQAYMAQSQRPDAQHAARPTGLPDALRPALPQGIYPQNFAQGQGQFIQPQGQHPYHFQQQQQWQNFAGPQNVAMWGQQQRVPVRQPYTLQYRHPPQEFQAPSRPQMSFSEITCTRCRHSNPIINITCEICRAKLPLIDSRLLQQDSRFLPEPRPSMRELGLPEVLKPPPAMEYKPAQSPKVPATASSQKSKQTPYRTDAIPSQKAEDIIMRPPMEQPTAGLVQTNVGQTTTTAATSAVETHEQAQSTASTAARSQTEVIKPPSPLVSSQSSRTLSPAKLKGFSQKWQCETCTFINEPGTRICAVCDKTSDNPQFIQGEPGEQVHEVSVTVESGTNVEESLSHLSLEGFSASGAPGKRPETMGGDLTPVDTAVALPGAGGDVNTQKVPGGTVVEIQDQIWREKQLAKKEDAERQRASLSPALLMSNPPDMPPQRQAVSDIPDSPMAERQTDLSSLGQSLEPERRTMNIRELQERKRQEDMRTEGLQMIKWFREAEHAGFLPEEVQAALFHCENGNPVNWLKENWQELVASVAAQATEEGKKLKTNIVGVITTQEAAEALRKQEGDIPKSIKECIDCRRKKFIYVMEYQEFEQDQVLTALQENCGDTEKAILAIQKEQLRPFEEHIWKRETDENRNRVELKEGDFERNVRMLLCQYNLPSWGRAEQAVKLLESGEYDDYDFGDIIEAVRSCLGLESCKKYLQHECQVCTDVLPQHKLLVLTHCSCEVCVSCMKQYFTITIRDKNIKDMVCPVCSQPDLDDDEDAESEFFNLLDIMLKSILDREVHGLFQQKLRDRTLMKLPNFRWCSQCSSGMINDQPDRRLKMVCADCGSITCYKCKKPWEDQHENSTCEQFQAWKEMNDPEFQAAGLAAILNESGIDCPNCKFRYALAKGGCMHFKCIQCKHEFCSGCYNTFRHNCTRFASCARKGLHAHHPRDCLFYMRDRDPVQLQRLLNDNNVEYDTDPPPASQQAENAGNGPVGGNRCQVMEQKETNDGLRDDHCGLEAPPGYAGLCRLHYIEYLVGLINTHKIDPVVIMDSDELRALLLREEKQVPQPQRREGERAFWQRLVQEVQQRLPLSAQPPRERDHT